MRAPLSGAKFIPSERQAELLARLVIWIKDEDKITIAYGKGMHRGREITRKFGPYPSDMREDLQAIGVVDCCKEFTLKPDFVKTINNASERAELVAWANDHLKYRTQRAQQMYAALQADRAPVPAAG
jgi:hypothetical protein